VELLTAVNRVPVHCMPVPMLSVTLGTDSTSRAISRVGRVVTITGRGEDEVLLEYHHSEP